MILNKVEKRGNAFRGKLQMLQSYRHELVGEGKVLPEVTIKAHQHQLFCKRYGALKGCTNM